MFTFKVNITLIKPFIFSSQPFLLHSRHKMAKLPIIEFPKTFLNPKAPCMYTIGIIKTDLPKALINPKMCRTPQELIHWLTSFFNKDDFKLSEPITLESLTAALTQNKPIRVPIEGYAVAILLGADEVIQNATNRFVHVIDLDLLEATAPEIQASLIKYVK